MKITPDKNKALFLAKKQVTALVYNTIQLEDINYTLPEVQTLLDGITVGGYTLHEQEITINQYKSWCKLFDLVKDNKMSLTKEIACQLHEVAGKNEALKWGVFRDGSVSISGTDYIPPNANHLDHLFFEMINSVSKEKNIYKKAGLVFLNMARNQYFYDVNNRTGRLMMNGILLSEGYPAINIKAKDRLEFNTLMIEFYSDNNPDPILKFLTKSIDSMDIQLMKTNKDNC